MKRIIVIFSLIFFALTSCNENKAKENNVEIATIDNNDLKLPERLKQDIDLYLLNDLEENTGKKVGFISLSDKYSDSLAIPNLDNIEKENLQYFKLSSDYRKRFLSKTKISETDNVFIYDYSNDILLSFPVKNLNVVANLNIYRTIDDYPLTQDDYEIGFEINKTLLGELDKYYDVFVFVGKESPFVKGQIKPIRWEKIDSKEFPLTKSNLSKTAFLHKNTKKGNVYLYNSEKYQYFLQDFIDAKNSDYIIERHLIIIDNNNGNVIIERVFSDSESTSIVPLNFGVDNPNWIGQWAGKLFKNKSEVVFGFEWATFGCSNIIFLNSQESDIYINCDNRH